MNEIVPRQHRREIFHYLKKNFADYFDGKDLQKELDEMSKRTEQLAQQHDQEFVQLYSDRINRPEFVFEINLND